jgi:hypothetical protein
MVKTLAAVIMVASVGVAHAGEAPQAVDQEGLPVQPPSMVQPRPPGAIQPTPEVDDYADETPPSSGGKLVGEALFGGLLGAGGIIAGAYIGYGLETSDGCHSEFCGFGGAILGGTIGMTLAVPAGVYVIGSTGGETGSFGATLGGSVLGTLVGIGAVAATQNEAGGVIFFAAPLAGAMIGFNATRRYERGHRARNWAPVASATHGTTSFGVVGRF